MISIKQLIEAYEKDALSLLVNENSDFAEIFDSINERIKFREKQIPEVHAWLTKELKKSELEDLDNQNQIEIEYERKMERILTELDLIREVRYEIEKIFSELEA